MRIAASSPVWFTRSAEERKSRWEGVSGRVGFEAGGVAVVVVVLWCRRDGIERGARKSRTGARREAVARSFVDILGVVVVSE
jgi:hypothetical protein